jgi:hypothetical protein
MHRGGKIEVNATVPPIAVATRPKAPGRWGIRTRRLTE